MFLFLFFASLLFPRHSHSAQRLTKAVRMVPNNDTQRAIRPTQSLCAGNVRLAKLWRGLALSPNTKRPRPDHSIFPGQESTLVRVPSYKEIPVDMTPTLQERLNGITEVLSRVSKLVAEDLEKAVSAVVGQDKQGGWRWPLTTRPPLPPYPPSFRRGAPGAHGFNHPNICAAASGVKG